MVQLNCFVAMSDFPESIQNDYMSPFSNFQELGRFNAGCPARLICRDLDLYCRFKNNISKYMEIATSEDFYR
jgi:hypothetical protein